MKTFEKAPTDQQSHHRISTAQIELAVNGPDTTAIERQKERATAYDAARQALRSAIEMKNSFDDVPISSTNERQLNNLCIGSFHNFAALLLSEQQALDCDVLPEQRYPDEEAIPSSFVDLQALMGAYDALPNAAQELDPIIETVIDDIRHTDLTDALIRAYVNVRVARLGDVELKPVTAQYAEMATSNTSFVVATKDVAIDV